MEFPGFSGARMAGQIAELGTASSSLPGQWLIATRSSEPLAGSWSAHLPGSISVAAGACGVT